jgi:hypothetical protein
LKNIQGKNPRTSALRRKRERRGGRKEGKGEREEGERQGRIGKRGSCVLGCGDMDAPDRRLL